MGSAIATLLAPAVGVLVSPIPIAGLLLILLSDKAGANSIFYTLGWMVGNAVVFTIGLLCMSLGIGTEEPGTGAKVVSLLLGVLLIILAVGEFLKRPKKGDSPPTPNWFAKMKKIGIGQAAGSGFFLSALNPVNALLSLGAGAGVGALGLGMGQQALSLLVFTLLASASIILPTVAFLLAGHRLDQTLDVMRKWLVKNNAIITSVLLLVIGLGMVSKVF